MKSAPTRQQISSGGIVFRPSSKGLEFALIRKSTVRGRTVWCLPKGWVEPGETLETAAIREVREETGLEAKILNKLGEISYWFYDPQEKTRIHKTVHFFLMEFLGGDPSLHDDEVEEARWFETDEAARGLSYPTERDIFGKALALLKK